MLKNIRILFKLVGKVLDNVLLIHPLKGVAVVLNESVFTVDSHKKTKKCKLKSAKSSHKEMSEQFNKTPIGLLCSEFTKDLINHPMSGIFRKPVTDENYLSVIKHPMDLDTIRKKIKENVYKSLNEWKSDVNLIFENAIKFNGEESISGSIALYFKQKVEKKYRKFELFNVQNYEERLRDLFRKIEKEMEKLTNEKIEKTPKYSIQNLCLALNKLSETTEAEKIIRAAGDQKVLKKYRNMPLNLDGLSRKTLDQLWLQYGENEN